jgi:CRP/FNR family transcriptional regulator, anaerobic regulatory protein
MTQFLNFLNQISPLSDEAQKAIEKVLVKKEYPKNSILIAELSKCDKLYFIESGLARAFYFKDGKDITDWFGLENAVIGPVVRHFPTKSTPHSVELLEASRVISIHFSDLENLYNQYHEIERLGRLIAIHTILMLQQKIDHIQFLTAKERYDDFIKTYPSILQRVQLGHIATYLGMNQVTLSRARKQLSPAPVK